MQRFVTVTLMCIGLLGVDTETMGSQDTFTVPDIRFMSVADAERTMRAAGFVGQFREDTSSLCGSVVDGHIVELGHVCHQVPFPNASFRKRGTVHLRVQSEDPRHGRLGEFLEWHLMPRIIDMTEADALQALRDAGFTVQDRIRVKYTDEPGCSAGRVCRTSPAPDERAGQNDDKTITIGRQ